MEDEEVRSAIAAMVADDGYPCVGAKSVFTRHNVTLRALDRLADPAQSRSLLAELTRFSAQHPVEAAEDDGAFPALASFIAAFRRPVPATEEEFEQLLWRQLGLLHDADGEAWDQRVSSDPTDAHFGFSVAGRAFFVVGMHPAASRMARRAPVPLLVFNLHSQFEQLRATGHYDRLRDTVRRRDTLLQGCPNPMVADHGRRSEARQYSGRSVPEDWQPPQDFSAPPTPGASC